MLQFFRLTKLAGPGNGNLQRLERETGTSISVPTECNASCSVTIRAYDNRSLNLAMEAVTNVVQGVA